MSSPQPRTRLAADGGAGVPIQLFYNAPGAQVMCTAKIAIGAGLV